MRKEVSLFPSLYSPSIFPLCSLLYQSQVPLINSLFLDNIYQSFIFQQRISHCVEFLKFLFYLFKKKLCWPRVSVNNGRPLWPSPAHLPLQVYGQALNYLEEWQIVHRNNSIPQQPPDSFLLLSLAFTSLQNTNLKPYLPAISIFLSQVSNPRRQAAVVYLHSAALFNKCQPGH